MQPADLNTTSTTLHIRNMTSNSCVRLVRENLERTGFIKVLHVELGMAQVNYNPQVVNEKFIDDVLRALGFELIDNKDARIVEQIKTSVIQLIFYGNNSNSLIRNSDYLSDKIGLPYSSLSKLFSEKTGVTLEKYILLIKMERIKELISYGEMTLSEISYQMGYSSVQYLSTQFKQLTGLSVTDFKHSKTKHRIPLNQITKS